MVGVAEESTGAVRLLEDGSAADEVSKGLPCDVMGESFKFDKLEAVGRVVEIATETFAADWEPGVLDAEDTALVGGVVETATETFAADWETAVFDADDDAVVGKVAETANETFVADWETAVFDADDDAVIGKVAETANETLAPEPVILDEDTDGV